MGLTGPLVITGAAGFIGANLCRYFLDRGHRVIALEGHAHPHWRIAAIEREQASHFFPAAGSEAGSFERVVLDLTERKKLRDWLRAHSPEVVLNCAAYGAYPSQTDTDPIYGVNFDAVRTMLECLREQSGFRAFIQAGSSSEYGANCTQPGEDYPTLPDSDYAVSKIAASQLVRFYGYKNAFPGWTLRLYSVYGPYEESSRLIPRLLSRAAVGELPPLVNPSVSRDFVYVGDICRAFEAVIEKSSAIPKGGIYNIGSGIKTTLADLVETARATFGLEKEPVWGSMADRKWDHAEWFANPEKAARELGWRATTSLSDGLRATQAWMARHPELVDESQKQSILPGERPR